LRSRWNPFGLTPDARAFDAGINLTDNVLARIGELGDPEDMVQFINRVADGTLSPQFGHMIVTPQGRYIRATAQATEVPAFRLLKDWQLTAGERNILNLVAQYTGEDIGKVFSLIKNGEEAALYTRFADNVAKLGDDAARVMEEAVAIGLADASSLRTAAGIFGEVPLLTPELFRVNLIHDIGEAATRIAVAKFGVKARGFIVKFANTVKSAETLAFLRMNPGYPIRNFINNEFTMLARGNWGGMGIEGAVEFWKRLGFEPARLRVGVGPAEIAVAALKGEAAVTGQAALSAVNEGMAEVSSGKYGALDKIRDWFSSRNLGKLDMGVINSKIEANASMRATTTGVKRYLAKYKKVLKVADFDPILTERIMALDNGRDIIRGWQNALADALTEAEVDAVLFSDNLALSERNVVSLFTEKTGVDLYDIMDAEDRFVRYYGRRGCRCVHWKND
jgi:hypothetical protein